MDLDTHIDYYIFIFVVVVVAIPFNIIHVILD